MAEQLVSPGVFTEEHDLSFLPTGISQMNAVFIGPFTKGNSFTPTIVTGIQDAINKFGDVSEENYSMFAVKEYLKEASQAMIVRVLPEGGYNTATVEMIISGSNGYKTVGVFAPSTKWGTGGSDGMTLAGSTIYSGSAGGTLLYPSQSALTFNAYLTLSGSGVINSTWPMTGSLNPTNQNSLFNVAGTTVNTAQPLYTYIGFKSFISSSLLTHSCSFAIKTAGLNLSGSTDGASRPAQSPMIRSFGLSPVDLFQIETIPDGTINNIAFKVSIVWTTIPTDTDYGVFNLYVRDGSDSDQRPIVLETFTGLTLDPDASTYIARVIGDKYEYTDATGKLITTGNYTNNSSYIRVIMDSGVENKAVPITTMPGGFVALTQPYVGTAALPTASMITSITKINGLYSKKVYYGFDYTSTDNLNYLKPKPNGATVGNNAAFNLYSCTTDGGAQTANTSMATYTIFSTGEIPTYYKFTVPFQDGFDGIDPAVPKLTGTTSTPMSGTNTFGMVFTNTTSDGTAAYIKALQAISNADAYDINMIVLPGITINDHSAVVNYAIDVAEERGDCLVIVDVATKGKTATEAVTVVENSGIDSSYAACWYPWVSIMDTNRNKPIWVPPSVVVPAVIAYNDAVAYEWWAPAGLNRGGVRRAIDIENKLTSAERGQVYTARINPIATFPGQGISIWGQKDLQRKASALDRLSVRRSLLAMKKYIASATRYLVFDNNTTQTRSRFVNIVEPYLESIKQKQGLYAFKVVMDETINTPDLIDRYIMYGQIWIQPARAAEYIKIDFNITPTGAQFSGI